jgi:putative spermidine/putrescine transport system permease protein
LVTRPDTLIIPGLLFVSIAFLWPVIVLLLEAMQGGGGMLGEYATLVATPGMMAIMWRTIWISALVCLICFLIGYPFAYVAATTSLRARTVLLGVVAVSLFFSLIVRCYAWLAILDRSGLVNMLLQSGGLGAFRFIAVHNLAGVLIGVVQFTLPLMILSIYDSMRRIDSQLLSASLSLGASPARTFLEVYLPLTLPGVFSGVVIVFITTLGYYIVPAILGGPQNMMIGEVIATKIRTTGEWGLGAAIATIVLVIALVIYALMYRVTAKWQEEASA